MKKLLMSLLSLASLLTAWSQTGKDLKETEDSLYIKEVEESQAPAKVLHAEPLYIDLIRDLGARKGEKEWNIGLGLTDKHRYDAYEALIEYEFAPINRLGLEVELPFTIYSPTAGNTNTPGNKLNSLKLAAQYTFLVSEKKSTSMALGYIHEFELTDFKSYGKSPLYSGNVFNPFLVAAKRWGNNFHSLLYTGPAIARHFYNKAIVTSWQINSNLHYMIPGTRNFIGLELNKAVEQGNFDMTLRPQMRVSVADNLLVGIVTGIPVNRSQERFSSFLRLIYEPGHKRPNI